MEKEFKALDFLKQQAIAFEHSELAIKVANENHTIVKQALTELQAIKEAKPSEELEALRRIKIFLGYNYCSVDLPNELKCVEQALIKAQEQEEDIIHYKGTVENLRRDNTLLKEIKNEQEKVLEIIKEKCLYTDNLNYVSTYINYDVYKEKMSKKYDTVVVKIDWNDKVLLDYLKLLIQEEFETLKRWASGWKCNH